LDEGDNIFKSYHSPNQTIIEKNNIKVNSYNADADNYREKYKQQENEENCQQAMKAQTFIT